MANQYKMFSKVTTYEKNNNLYMCFKVNGSDDIEDSKIVRYDLLRRTLTAIDLIEEGYSVKKYFYRCPKKIYFNVNINDILADGYYNGKKSDLEKQNKRLDRKIKVLQKNLEYFKSKYPELVI